MEDIDWLVPTESSTSQSPMDLTSLLTNNSAPVLTSQNTNWLFLSVVAPQPLTDITM
ncbi:hypothetical protein STEG23_013011, partial [Scotinomys teguina]